MKTRSLLCLLLLSATILLTGCVGGAITAAQAEGKLPGADVESATVKLSTIYGTSYTLTVKDVRHNPDGTKTYGQYASRFTSPAGTAEVEAKGVTVSKSQPK